MGIISNNTNSRIDMHKAALRLRSIKDRIDYSPTEFTKVMGKSRQAWSDWLSGRTRTTDRSLCERLANHLDLDPEWLCDGKGDELFSSSGTQLELYDELMGRCGYSFSPLKMSVNAIAVKLDSEFSVSFSKGDVLFVEPFETVVGGDFVVTRTGGSTIDIKQATKVDGVVWLKPVDSSLPINPVSLSEVEYIGKIKSALRVMP